MPWTTANENLGQDVIGNAVYELADADQHASIQFDRTDGGLNDKMKVKAVARAGASSFDAIGSPVASKEVSVGDDPAHLFVKGPRYFSLLVERVGSTDAITASAIVEIASLPTA